MSTSKDDATFVNRLCSVLYAYKYLKDLLVMMMAYDCLPCNSSV